MASIDTIAPLRVSMSRSSGIAVISLDFPSTARWRARAPPGWRKPKPDAARLFPSGDVFEPRSVLAVHRDHPLGFRAQGGRPGGEAALQRLCVQQAEHLAQRLRRRDAVCERQKAAQPLQRPAATSSTPSQSSPRTRRQPASPAELRPKDRSPSHPMVRNNPHMIQKPKRHGVALQLG